MISIELEKLGVNKLSIERGRGHKVMSLIIDLIKGPNNWPMVVIFVGGILTLAGGFWSNYQQGVSDKTITNSIMGGDSFCYLYFGVEDGFLTLLSNGKYPMYDVKIRVVDLDKFETKNIFESGTSFDIGNIPSGVAMMVSAWGLPKDKEKIRYNVFISARNGFFSQEVRLAKVNGKWKEALRVLKDNNKNLQPMYQDIPDDYPRNKEGKIDW